MNQKPLNVDEYLTALPDNVRESLETLRQTIKNAVPDAEEVISYQMPAFKFHGMLIWYAAFKKHYSLFAHPPVLLGFKDELKSYQLSKSGIRIPLDEPVPVQLITEIVRLGAKVNLEREQLKSKRKK